MSNPFLINVVAQAYLDAWFIFRVLIAYLVSILDPLWETPAGQWAQYILSRDAFGEGPATFMEWSLASLALISVLWLIYWVLTFPFNCGPIHWITWW